MVFYNAANKDLPTDKELRVDNAANLIGQQAGGLSFWLTPQWEATDTSRGTLVQLGAGDVHENALAITKDAQSLHFTFADGTNHAAHARHARLWRVRQHGYRVRPGSNHRSHQGGQWTDNWRAAGTRVQLGEPTHWRGSPRRSRRP